MARARELAKSIARQRRGVCVRNSLRAVLTEQIKVYAQQYLTFGLYAEMLALVDRPESGAVPARQEQSELNEILQNPVHREHRRPLEVSASTFAERITPEFYQKEVDAIFRKVWLPGGKVLSHRSAGSALLRHRGSSAVERIFHRGPRGRRQDTGFLQCLPPSRRRRDQARPCQGMQEGLFMRLPWLDLFDRRPVDWRHRQHPV